MKTCKVDMETNARLAQEAIARGENKYISVNHCRKGHLMRYVANHKCVDCKCEAQHKRTAGYTEAQKETQRGHSRKYFAKRYREDADFRATHLKNTAIRDARTAVVKQADKLLVALARLEKLK